MILKLTRYGVYKHIKKYAISNDNVLQEVRDSSFQKMLSHFSKCLCSLATGKERKEEKLRGAKAKEPKEERKEKETASKRRLVETNGAQPVMTNFIRTLNKRFD
jgi:hypothetical protein